MYRGCGDDVQDLGEPGDLLLAAATAMMPVAITSAK
jgi:hypothetical protein